MQAVRVLRWTCALAVFGAALASAQLTYTATQPVLLHNGAGSSVFTITNPGPTPLPLALHIGAFSDDTSQAPLTAPTVAFTWDAGGGPMPATIGPAASLRFQVKVSGFSGSSVASSPLFNGAAILGRLQVVEADSPLDVTISGDPAAGPAFVLKNGEDAQFTLANSDDQSYPLDWVFQVAGQTIQSGELQLAAHGRAQIELTPTSDLYSWTDNLRPSTRTGTVQLSLHGPPNVPAEMLPQRTLQVSLLMRRLSPTATTAWLDIAVVLVLLLGGLLSLIANSVLPNILRKLALRRQVNQLAQPARSISTRVDPYLRTLLRMERKRLDLMLRRSSALSPASGENFESVAAGINRFRQHLKVTERLDELRRRLEQDAVVSPPSAIDDIDGKLQLAENNLRSFSLTDDELNTSTRFLDAAEGSLGMLGDHNALAQLTAANFRDLKVRQKLLAYSYYSDLYTALPGLFEMLNQPFDDPRNITRPMIFAIDYGIAALQLAFDFAILRVSAPAVAMGGGSDVTQRQSPRQRLLARQGELVSLLGTLSWSALRELRVLLQQMRENIYETDILEEIANIGQAEIVYDPRVVHAYTPMSFSIRFRDPRFNGAAAAKRLTCAWDFPRHPIEKGWQICHFFRGNEAKRDDGRDVIVSVRVESPKPAEGGSTLISAESARLLRSTLEARFEVQRPERPPYSGAVAESVRFFIAFGVALAALFSGALQQLNRLDFLPAMIAVLAIGFGADTVKNLLVQTSRRAAL